MHLIQHPAKYHMQKVRVIGFAGVEFEGTALYVSRDDHENGISKNGVWLDMDIRLVPVDNSLIFINFMSRLRAKRTDSLTNRFFLLSIWPV